MKLQLTRPLCFFDLETTGTNIVNDRIVEIAILKLHPSGEEEEKSWLVNPERPIPEEVSAIHGITNEKVADKPTFKQLSGQIYGFIKKSDLAGFNSNRFDIPVLVEELLRAKVNFDFRNIKAIDVQNIFHKMEQRTLSAALKFYCNQELVNAHSALADTRATHDVLMAQLERYGSLENKVTALSEFSCYRKTADFAGFILYDKEGDERFGFGKHKGKKISQVLEEDSGYFGWVLDADFPLYTKKILAEIRLRQMNTKNN